MANWRFLLLGLFIMTGSFLPAIGQTITSIAPGSGTPGESITVTIIGKNTTFQQGVTKVAFSNGITASNFHVTQKGLCVTASIKIPSSATTANATFTVTTNNQVVYSSFSGINFSIFSSSSLGTNFNANLDLMPFETITLKNIDLTNPAIQPMAFLVNIFNGSIEDTFAVTVSLGNHLGLIGSMTKKNIPVGAYGNANVSNRGFTSVKINGTNGNNFLNIIETTGDFPVDNYTYSLTVTGSHGKTVTTTTNFVLTNPVAAASNPELITPGATISQMLQDCYLSYPQFQWFGVYDNYDFALYFWRPGQTAEEVVRGRPVYEQKVVGATNIVYPTSAERLIDSAEYAWQILANVTTASGIQQIPSQVFRFRYVNLGSTGKGMVKLVNTIEIFPQELTIAPGKEHQFTALCYDQDGVLIPNVKPVWDLSPAGYGTISPTGLFTAGLAKGEIAVIVKADKVIQFAPVIIGSSSATVQQPVKQSTTAPAVSQPWDMNGVMRKIFGVTNQ